LVKGKFRHAISLYRDEILRANLSKTVCVRSKNFTSELELQQVNNSLGYATAIHHFALSKSFWGLLYFDTSVSSQVYLVGMIYFGLFQHTSSLHFGHFVNFAFVLRHQAGHRGKVATSDTAGVRQSYACHMMGTG
jgi:hypothetical protein